VTLDLRLSRVSVADCGDVVPSIAEVLYEQIPNVWLIIYDEHMEGSGTRLWHGDCLTPRRVDCHQ
jgi:hypothetical protein